MWLTQPVEKPIACSAWHHSMLLLSSNSPTVLVLSSRKSNTQLKWP